MQEIFSIVNSSFYSNNTNKSQPCFLAMISNHRTILKLKKRFDMSFNPYKIGVVLLLRTVLYKGPHSILDLCEKGARFAILYWSKLDEE